MKKRLAILIMFTVLLGTALSADTKFLTFISQVKGFTATQIHFFEKYLYVVNDHHLQVFSLTNPWSPRLEAGFESTSPISDIVNLETNRLYICSPDPGVKITESDSLNSFGKIFFVDKLICSHADREGALLYTADASRGLEIYNLGNGLLPSKLTTFSEKWGIRALVASYPHIHALNDFGYVNIDITNTSFPITAGKNYEVVEGEILCVNDNYAWIGAGSTLVVMDINDAAHPVIVNRYRFNSHINTLVAKDSELYVGLESEGLKIMDISNPMHITNTQSYFLEEGVYEIALNAEYIYLASGSNGWIILRYI